MATIHLIEGPVGAGKSTYAAKLSLAQGLLHLDLDEWMVHLFSADRPEQDFMPWYSERKQRCIEQIWRVANELLSMEQNVILELGLVQLADRESFYQRVDATDFELTVHLLDVPVGVRQERVRARNEQAGATFKMHVSDEIFALANAAWQAPDDAELRARDFLVVSN